MRVLLDTRDSLKTKNLDQDKQCRAPLSIPMVRKEAATGTGGVGVRICIGPWALRQPVNLRKSQMRAVRLLRRLFGREATVDM